MTCAEDAVRGTHGRQPPGCCGKIPARGDFLARRVPALSRGSWDGWLSEVAAAPGAAGEAGWCEAWLGAPLWHFRLGAQLVPPDGAAGVLIASSDRVGRLFPFSLIGAVGPTHCDVTRWHAAIERLVLLALDDAADPDAIDAGLQRIGPPPALPEDAAPEGVARLAAMPATAPLGHQTLWWSQGSERVAAVLLRCAGLPGRAVACAMMLGGPDVRPPAATA